MSMSLPLIRPADPGFADPVRKPLVAHDADPVPAAVAATARPVSPPRPAC